MESPTTFQETAAADAVFEGCIRGGSLRGIPHAATGIIAASTVRTTANSVVREPGWGEGRAATVTAQMRDVGALLRWYCLDDLDPMACSAYGFDAVTDHLRESSTPRTLPGDVIER